MAKKSGKKVLSATGFLLPNISQKKGLFPSGVASNPRRQLDFRAENPKLFDPDHGSPRLYSAENPKANGLHQESRTTD